MQPMLARRAANDEGVTLVELIIAALILFIAVTAVFGLVLKSLDMSVQAKQQNVAISAGSSYIEQVRALPYEAVGVLGATAPSVAGSLSVSTTMVVSGFQVVVTPTVLWVTDPVIGAQAYKSLSVTVTVSAPGVARPVTRVVQTYVRRSQAQQAQNVVPGALSIAFGSTMPARGAYISLIRDIPFQAQNSNPAVNLTTVDILASKSTVIRDGTTEYASGRLTRTDGTLAQWVDLDVNPYAGTFPWDTTSTEPDGVTPRWPDGTYDLDASTQDRVGNLAHARWAVVIDNQAPISPPVPWASLTRADLSRTYWSRSASPTMDAYVPGIDGHHYVVHVWQDNRGSQAVSAGPGEWGTLWSDLAEVTVYGPTTYYDRTTLPLTRYFMRVEPKNIDEESAGMTDMARPFVSRPSMSASSTVTYAGGSTKAWTTVTSVRMAGANFDSTSRSIQLYRNTTPSMTGAIPITGATWTTDASSYAFTDTVVGAKNDPALTYYYRMQVDIVPSGWHPSTWIWTRQLTVYSAWLGPTPTAAAAGAPLGSIW